MNNLLIKLCCFMVLKLLIPQGFAQVITGYWPAEFNIQSSAYPQKKIRIMCQDEQFLKVQVIGLVGSGKSKIANFDYVVSSEMAELSTGSLKFGKLCDTNIPKDGGIIPGLPCFGAVKGMWQQNDLKRLVKEGRQIKAGLLILGTPLAFTLDVFATVSVIPVIAKVMDSTYVDDVEISREKKQAHKRALRRYKKLEKIIEEIDETGMLVVSDRVFDKFYRQIFKSVRP